MSAFLIMLLLIDNYDSFTYNLVHYFEQLGQQVLVKRNDEIDLKGIESLAPEYLVLSPGPCTPNEAGITLEAIKTYAGKIPMFGVCLGYQAIGQVFGAKVTNANTIMHGKTSNLFHNGSGLFAKVNSPFTATRYHSLVLSPASIPPEFEVTAWSGPQKIEEVMAIEHRDLPVCGVQFHPESILTESGLQILQNFLDLY